MKKILHISLILMLALSSCKEPVIDQISIEDTFRIKKIIDYDETGTEISRDIFSYDEDKVVLWQSFYYTEEGEPVEITRTNITYRGDYVNLARFCKKEGQWTLDEKCVYLVCGNLVREELFSRYGFPRCLECWKYEYEYKDGRLTNWHSLINNGNGSLDEFRKGIYAYAGNDLNEYCEFELNADSEWAQSYKRVYSSENALIKGWQGGSCADGLEWQPDQKIEYLYVNNNIATRKYSIHDETSDSWKLFGSLNYSYDLNNNLVEKISSFGSRTVYEYEAGSGNTSLFYYDVEDFCETEPTCKSGILTSTKNQIPDHNSK